MKKPHDNECSYCGAGKGEACIVTLAPEVGPLSIVWWHSSREEGLVA